MRSAAESSRSDASRAADGAGPRLQRVEQPPQPLQLLVRVRQPPEQRLELLRLLLGGGLRQHDLVDPALDLDAIRVEAQPLRVAVRESALEAREGRVVVRRQRLVEQRL